MYGCIVYGCIGVWVYLMYECMGKCIGDECMGDECMGVWVTSV